MDEVENNLLSLELPMFMRNFSGTEPFLIGIADSPLDLLLEVNCPLWPKAGLAFKP
jgi:hypothetical protein